MDQLPSTAFGTLRLMPQTALQVRQFSNQLINAVREGSIDPLELVVFLRGMESVSETVRKEIRDNIQNALDKFSEKSIEMYGARLEKAEVGVRYRYETSGDMEWERLDAEIKSLTARREAREKFLRTLDGPINVVDEENTGGEVITIRPPLKTGSPGVKVFLK